MDWLGKPSSFAGGREDGGNKTIPEIATAREMVRLENDCIRACCRTFRGDRPRLNARVGLGALSAGQAW